MFALIEPILTCQLNRIGRIKRRLHGYKGITVTAERILGMPALRVMIDISMPRYEAAVEKEIALAYSFLRQQRVRSVCFREDFPCKQVIMQNPLMEIGTKKLYEAMAGQVAAIAAGNGEQTALFWAKRLLPESISAIYKLCSSFRYVMVSIETGDRDLNKSVLENTGASIIVKPSARQMLDADIAVFFDLPNKTVCLPEKCIVIEAIQNISEAVKGNGYISKIDFSVSNRIRDAIPEGYPMLPLLSEAIGCGNLKTEDIIIDKVNICRVLNQIYNETDIIP